MRKRAAAPALTAVGIAASVSIGCSGDSPEPRDLSDLTAVWQMATTVSANTCDGDFGGGTELITLIQCGSQVSVITAGGLWGSGAVDGEALRISGSETQTDQTGCRSTQQSSGEVSGTADRLTGAFTTTVTFDAGSCGARPACTIEQSLNLNIAARYRSSCIDRDQFGLSAASDYVLPFPAGQAYVLNNSYCIPTGGHREQQAYDFLMPIGDNVIASRSGVVRRIKDDSPDNGQGADHNHVMIEHADGTVAFYAHLKQASVLVAEGQAVEAGESIALAGHSGTTDVAHLHFGVYGRYPPVEGDDRAVNFRNTNGPVDCRGGLVRGASYEAQAAQAAASRPYTRR